jgi:hypothetical protein
VIGNDAGGHVRNGHVHGRRLQKIGDDRVALPTPTGGANLDDVFIEECLEPGRRAART